jgi:PD-(D/E)XK nuclease superfamily
MPPNEFTTELDKIKRERAQSAILPLVNGGENAYIDLAAALDQLSAGVRDEAALWEKHKKKGWQSTKTSLLAVAGKLNELGQELDRADAPPARRGIEPGGDPNQAGTAPRGNPENFVYHEPSDAEIAVHAERLAAEALTAPPGTFSDAEAAALLDSTSDADSQARTRAFLRGEINSLDAPLPTTTDTPIIDTVHQEARTMLEVRRAEAANGDPFTDPPKPGGYVFTDVEPITFEQLMTPAPVPAELKHWSYSQLSTLDECEVKYAGGKIFGKPSLPQWSLVGGNALHAAIEIFEREMLAAGVHPVRLEDEAWRKQAWDDAFTATITETVDASNIMPDDWRAANGGKENFDWWRVEGEHMLKLYIEQRFAGIAAAQRAGTQPRRLFGLGDPAVPVLELALSIGVDGPMGNLEFKAIIDQAWLCHDGTLLIVDIKTGRQLPSAFDTFQLGSQAIVLAKHIGIQPPAPFVKACYYDARKGIYTTPIGALTRHPMAELAYRMHTAEARRQAGIYRPYVSTRGCTGCGIRKLCPLMGGQ